MKETEDVTLRLGISTCLLGEEVRYDGGHKLDRFLARTLVQYVEWVPVCPEVEIGQLVARAGSLPWEELSDEYPRLLMEGLGVMTSSGKHANVVQHLMGFLKDKLGREDKAELLEGLADYQAGLLPLIVPLTLLRHHLRRHDVPDWVHRQVYLHPYPKELMLRNRI